MSLLDDTRRLYDEYMDEGNEKSTEAAMYYAELHPRIVAVLEAANTLVTRFGKDFPTEVEDQDVDTFAIAWACCGGHFASPHMAHCPWQGLVDALGT